MSERAKMANVDVAWLHMERPSNLMVINGLLWFDEPLDWDALKQIVTVRLVERFPKFSQRVVESGLPMGTPHWEPDRLFTVTQHLHHIALPEPGGQVALQEFVSDMIATPLDHTKPLWQVYLIDNYCGGSAVLARIHHCIADGISLARLLLSLTDEKPDAGIEPEEQHDPHPERLPFEQIQDGLSQMVDATRNAARVLWHKGAEILSHPERLMDIARVGGEGAKALGRMLFMGPDNPTVFKGELGIEKRAVWSQPIPLSSVKAIGRATGTTVNDVLLAAVTGALRSYLLRRESVVPEIRTFVPFNLRPLDAPIPRELGNHFGLVFLALPVGLDDPHERLLEVKRRMDSIKNSPEPAVAYGLLAAIGMTPLQLEQVIIDLFGTKASAVMTNVPGPRQPIYLAGSPVNGVMFWVPQSGALGLGVSIFSYNGQVTLGLAVDSRLVPDPEVILQAFQDEFDVMSRIEVG